MIASYGGTVQEWFRCTNEYLSEAQQETVQNPNSSAQQDILILSMFEQLSTKVTHCTNVNQALTTELDRYKEEVKDLKEKQNVENSFSGSNEQFAEIVRLKQNLFEQVQEKDSLMKTVSDLKNDLKMEENRNIDREIALEKKIKQLDNIIFKRGQSAQTVHMMTKSKICYDHSTKQAIGFEKPFYLKKARESKPKLYDGNTILKMDTIVIPDSDETLMLCEESRSKMLLKEQDPLFEKHRVNTKPINYAILNNDYYKRFVRQSDLYSEHAYWKATSVPALDPSHSSTTVIVEVPKELPKVSMVNTSLKELKRYLTGFDQVVKERTTATAITEGTWGFEHTKACFRDEIIPFIKELKDIFNNFNQYLVEELADVQKVFYQMEQAVEQHRLESKTFEVKMNQVLSENERLLAQAIDNDIVKTVVNLSLNEGCETVNECQRCLELKTELLNKKDFVDKETYEKLCKSFTTLEKHCITLEADSQLNQEIFQLENSVLNQNAPSFTQLFELSELRAQSQAKDTVIVKLKEQIKSLNGNVDDHTVKMDMDEIETLNIELEHRVTKLVAENEHLKQTYKQLYDSIKPKRVQSKEQCDALIKQDLLSHISRSCPSINNFGPQLVEVTPRKKDKKVRFAESLTSTENTKTDSTSNIVSNKRVLHSTGVRLSTSASGSQPSGNTRNDRIQQTPSSNLKNKVEAHPRNVKSSLNKRNGTVKVNGYASVQNSKKQDNSDYVCINSDDCMSSDNLCVSNSMNDVKFHAKPKKSKSKKDIWKPTGKEPSKSWGSTKTNIPSTSLNECGLSKSSSGIWTPVARSTRPEIALSSPISSVNSWVQVYYVEGLEHNLFSMGQFCDSNLEVAFRQHACFIRNLEGVDLLTGSRGDNLYTLSLGNMMASSPICLLHGLVRGLPKLKFEKDHLCSACALGKSSKKPHKPKSEDTNQEKLYLLWICVGQCVSRVSMERNDPSTLRNPFRRIRTDNGTEFVNQTLREYYEKVDISHETSVERSPQQNGVIERRNRTLIEAAHTMLIYAKAPLFLWAEAVATACYTQNRSMIRHRHGKTPYELLHDKPPDLSYLHVFGALCYPTNDSENLGKLQPKADIGIFIGYAPTKKAFRIYNRRTRRIIETIHVDFDELTVISSEHSSLGPTLHEMTPVTISSGLVPNPPSSTPFVPPSRSD
ncbi:retrovirus-related pol polyprotein from transposon TNT 1-94 [Tanacetum coccineum]